MTSPLYILCPGQGAQAVGMGKALCQTSPTARRTFERANQVLGFDLATLCFSGPEDRLNQTDISQPAIYVASVASYRDALEKGAIRPDEVAAFAGLSLGEYTALHLAGVFGFEDGLKLVAARGRFMQEAATATRSGMVAVMGADESQVNQLCDEARGDGVLVAANFNAPGQIVISGSADACGRAVGVAEGKGFKAIPLKVAGAFHSPLMQPAADRMRAELDAVRFSAPYSPVYANVTADVHGDEASIKDCLVRQIVGAVRWEQTMQKLASRPEARFIELAPGRVLAGLLKKINRRLSVESLGA